MSRQYHSRVANLILLYPCRENIAPGLQTWFCYSNVVKTLPVNIRTRGLFLQPRRVWCDLHQRTPSPGPETEPLPASCRRCFLQTETTDTPLEGDSTRGTSILQRTSEVLVSGSHGHHGGSDVGLLRRRLQVRERGGSHVLRTIGLEPVT
jgi:hypothetical protein